LIDLPLASRFIEPVRRGLKHRHEANAFLKTCPGTIIGEAVLKGLDFSRADNGAIIVRILAPEGRLRAGALHPFKVSGQVLKACG
jgi:hypothetical protein